MPKVIGNEDNLYWLDEYQNERDLENAVVDMQNSIFGSNRIYLDVKNPIGGKEKKQIPDGYLLDLSDSKPKLYLVENELARHSVDHIVMQMVGFSMAFKSDKRLVKSLVLQAIQVRSDAKSKCDKYLDVHKEYANLDRLIEHAVFEEGVAVVIIIDEIEITSRLFKALKEEITINTEILSLARYKRGAGALYLFDTFLEGFNTDIGSMQPPLDIDEVDTIIVPALEDGFNDTFIAENRWWAIRISGIMRPKIKYIAVYRVAPKSAITHIAPVASIEEWQDSDKFVVNFARPAHKLEREVPRGLLVKYLRNIQYTTLRRLQAAQTLDDI